MSVTTMLTPNPNKPGSIARVIVLDTTEDRLTVLHIDPLYDNPELLRRFNPGYTAAVKFWNIAAGLLVLGSIALSFFWHWWAFIPGIVVAAVVLRSNRRSVGDFASETLKHDPAAYHFFAGAGLIWTVSEERITRDTT